MNIVPLPPRVIRRRLARIAGATVAFLTFATLVAPAAGRARDGRWQAKLEPLEAGGPFELTRTTP